MACLSQCSRWRRFMSTPGYRYAARGYPQLPDAVARGWEPVLCSGDWWLVRRPAGYHNG